MAARTKPAAERVPVQRSVQRAAELKRLGLSNKAIAQRMGVSPPNVSRWLALAREQGLLGDQAT